MENEERRTKNEERVVYGNKRWVFPEVMDIAEKCESIVILSSNLDAKGFSRFNLRYYWSSEFSKFNCYGLFLQLPIQRKSRNSQ